MADQGDMPPPPPGAQNMSRSLRRTSSGHVDVDHVVDAHAGEVAGARAEHTTRNLQVIQNMSEDVADHLESTYGEALGEGVAAGAASNVMRDYAREVEEAEAAAAKQLQDLRDKAAARLKELQEKGESAAARKKREAAAAAEKARADKAEAKRARDRAIGHAKRAVAFAMDEAAKAQRKAYEALIVSNDKNNNVMLPKLFDLKVSDSGSEVSRWVRFGAQEDNTVSLPKDYYSSFYDDVFFSPGGEITKLNKVFKDHGAYARPTWWNDKDEGVFPGELQYKRVVENDGEDNWRNAASAALGKTLPRPHSEDESKVDDIRAAGELSMEIAPGNATRAYFVFDGANKNLIQLNRRPSQVWLSDANRFAVEQPPIDALDSGTRAVKSWKVHDVRDVQDLQCPAGPYDHKDGLSYRVIPNNKVYQCQSCMVEMKLDTHQQMFCCGNPYTPCDFQLCMECYADMRKRDKALEAARNSMLSIKDIPVMKIRKRDNMCYGRKFNAAGAASDGCCVINDAEFVYGAHRDGIDFDLCENCFLQESVRDAAVAHFLQEFNKNSRANNEGMADDGKNDEEDIEPPQQLERREDALQRRLRAHMVAHPEDWLKQLTEEEREKFQIVRKGEDGQDDTLYIRGYTRTRPQRGDKVRVTCGPLHVKNGGRPLEGFVCADWHDSLPYQLAEKITVVKKGNKSEMVAERGKFGDEFFSEDQVLLTGRPFDVAVSPEYSEGSLWSQWQKVRDWLEKANKERKEAADEEKLPKEQSGESAKFVPLEREADMKAGALVAHYDTVPIGWNGCANPKNKWALLRNEFDDHADQQEKIAARRRKLNDVENIFKIAKKENKEEDEEDECGECTVTFTNELEDDSGIKRMLRRTACLKGGFGFSSQAFKAGDMPYFTVEIVELTEANEDDMEQTADADTDRFLDELKKRVATAKDQGESGGKGGSKGEDEVSDNDHASEDKNVARTEKHGVLDRLQQPVGVLQQTSEGKNKKGTIGVGFTRVKPRYRNALRAQKLWTQGQKTFKPGRDRNICENNRQRPVTVRRVVDDNAGCDKHVVGGDIPNSYGYYSNSRCAINSSSASFETGNVEATLFAPKQDDDKKFEPATFGKDPQKETQYDVVGAGLNMANGEVFFTRGLTSDATAAHKYVGSATYEAMGVLPQESASEFTPTISFVNVRTATLKIRWRKQPVMFSQALAPKCPNGHECEAIKSEFKCLTATEMMVKRADFTSMCCANAGSKPEDHPLGNQAWFCPDCSVALCFKCSPKPGEVQKTSAQVKYAAPFDMHGLADKTTKPQSLFSVCGTNYKSEENDKNNLKDQEDLRRREAMWPDFVRNLMAPPPGSWEQHAAVDVYRLPFVPSYKKSIDHFEHRVGDVSEIVTEFVRKQVSLEASSYALGEVVQIRSQASGSKLEPRWGVVCRRPPRGGFSTFTSDPMAHSYVVRLLPLKKDKQQKLKQAFDFEQVFQPSRILGRLADCCENKKGPDDLCEADSVYVEQLLHSNPTSLPAFNPAEATAPLIRTLTDVVRYGHNPAAVSLAASHALAAAANSSFVKSSLARELRKLSREWSTNAYDLNFSVRHDAVSAMLLPVDETHMMMAAGNALTEEQRRSLVWKSSGRAPPEDEVVKEVRPYDASIDVAINLQNFSFMRHPSCEDHVQRVWNGLDSSNPMGKSAVGKAFGGLTMPTCQLSAPDVTNLSSSNSSLKDMKNAAKTMCESIKGNIDLLTDIDFLLSPAMRFATAFSLFGFLLVLQHLVVFHYAESDVGVYNKGFCSWSDNDGGGMECADPTDANAKPLTDLAKSMTTNEYLLVVVAFGFFVSEIEEVYNRFRDGELHKYFLDGWNYIDWILHFVFIAYLTVRIMALVDDNATDAAFYTKAAFRILSINCIFLWMRMMNVMTISKRLGTMIRMVALMTKDVLFFLVLFFMYAVGFAGTFYVWYSRMSGGENGDLRETTLEIIGRLNSTARDGMKCGTGGGVTEANCGNALGTIQGFDSAGFNTMWTTMQTLFMASLGDADLGELRKQDRFGPILMMLYLFVGAIMLLNLLIAMLNDVYTRTAENAANEFAYSKTQTVSNYRVVWKKRRTRISLPAPLNLIGYLIYPLQLGFNAYSAFNKCRARNAKWNCKSKSVQEKAVEAVKEAIPFTSLVNCYILVQSLSLFTGSLALCVALPAFIFQSVVLVLKCPILAFSWTFSEGGTFYAAMGKLIPDCAERSSWGGLYILCLCPIVGPVVYALVLVLGLLQVVFFMGLMGGFLPCFMVLYVAVSGFNRTAEACDDKHLDCKDWIQTLYSKIGWHQQANKQRNDQDQKLPPPAPRSAVTEKWLEKLQDWRQLHLRQQQFNSDMHRDTDDDRCIRALELDITHDVDKLRLASFKARNEMAEQKGKLDKERKELNSHAQKWFFGRQGGIDNFKVTEDMYVSQAMLDAVEKESVKAIEAAAAVIEPYSNVHLNMTEIKVDAFGHGKQDGIEFSKLRDEKGVEISTDEKHRLQSDAIKRRLVEQFTFKAMVNVDLKSLNKNKDPDQTEEEARKELEAVQKMSGESTFFLFEEFIAYMLYRFPEPLATDPTTVATVTGNAEEKLVTSVSGDVDSTAADDAMDEDEKEKQERANEAIAEAVAVRLEVDGPDGEAARKKFEQESKVKLRDLEAQNKQILDMLEHLLVGLTRDAVYDYKGSEEPAALRTKQNTRRSIPGMIRSGLGSLKPKSPLPRRARG